MIKPKNQKKKWINVASNLIVLPFCTLNQRNKKWWKVKYIWNITIILTFAWIILASSKCIEFVFFVRKYHV